MYVGAGRTAVDACVHINHISLEVAFATSAMSWQERTDCISEHVPWCIKISSFALGIAFVHRELDGGSNLEATFGGRESVCACSVA